MWTLKCVPYGAGLNYCFGKFCNRRGGGGGVGNSLGIFGWQCTAETLEPLAYTRASSAEFCNPILD